MGHVQLWVYEVVWLGVCSQGCAVENLQLGIRSWVLHFAMCKYAPCDVGDPPLRMHSTGYATVGSGGRGDGGRKGASHLHRCLRVCQGSLNGLNGLHGRAVLCRHAGNSPLEQGGLGWAPLLVVAPTGQGVECSDG